MRGRQLEPRSSGTLSWHHTEFGRRSDCERFRIVHKGNNWALLDARWNELGSAATILAAQQLAEGLRSHVARPAAGF